MRKNAKKVLCFALVAAMAATGLTSVNSDAAKKAKLKSVKKQVAAQEYTKPGSLRLTMNSDRFVNRTVTTRVIQNNNSNSSGGGSSVHNGSSGTSHGGKSGSF